MLPRLINCASIMKFSSLKVYIPNSANWSYISNLNPAANLAIGDPDILNLVGEPLYT